MSKLLQVNDLTTEFTGDFGKKISVDHVSFDVAEGETVCIVGESGCGKSVTSLSIMGLLGRGGAVVDGSVLFANKNLLDMDEKQLDTIRGNQMTMIFQDPLTRCLRSEARSRRASGFICICQKKKQESVRSRS